MYDPAKAIQYAHQWAFSRNPAYFKFDGIGGDCANFISQCLFAGCGTMNYQPTYGWYYRTPDDRTPSWSGVVFQHQFLTQNGGAGPYGKEAPLSMAAPGDVVQISFDGQRFTHSALVVSVSGIPRAETILIAAHSTDADNRALSTYRAAALRLVKIQDARP